MTIKMGVVMDPIGSINYIKDATLAMLWEAEKRGWQIYYFEQRDLFLRDSVPFGDASELNVFRDANHWFELNNKHCIPLTDLDVILMRKDPPFNDAYLHATYILEFAERLGVLIVNRPQSLRDANEKLSAGFFPQFCPPSLVTQSVEKLKAFWQEHQDIVCKPLNNMGGTSVFRLKENDVNGNVIFSTLTDNGAFAVAQKFIPEVKNGDKRILMVDGEPVPYSLARISQGDEWRSNLALGGKGIVQPLTERDLQIAAEVGPELRKRGLYFVGLDVIGDYLTEINVTSPGCIREIDAGASINISALLMDLIEKKLK